MNRDIKIDWVAIRDEIDLKTVIKDMSGRAVKNNTFLCPAHPDKNPSASLIPKRNKQRWCCFSCGEGGSNIDYVMYKNGCTRDEAAIYLGQAYGIGLSEDSHDFSVPQMLSKELLKEIGLAKNPFYPVPVDAVIETTKYAEWDFDKIPKDGYRKSMGQVVLGNKEAALLVAGKCSEYLCNNQSTPLRKKVECLLVEMTSLIKGINEREEGTRSSDEADYEYGT